MSEDNPGRVWSQSRKLLNEDAGGAGDGWVCVADGATPLAGGPDAARATALFASAIVKAFSDRRPGPCELADGIADALAEVQESASAAGVTATIAAAAWDRTSLATAVMGDSLILLEGPEEVTVVGDPAFAGREPRLLQPVVDALRAGFPPAEAYAAVRPVLASERGKRNSEAGVWVLSDRTAPGVIRKHLSVRQISRDGVSSIAAVTDGAWRGVDLFGLTDAAGLLRHAVGNTMGTYLADLAAAEEKDADRTRFPRFSWMDDATVAWSPLG